MNNTLEDLIRADKTPDGYSGKSNEQGLYDVGGTQWPRAAIGQSAVIMLERESGEFEVVLSQRAAHLVHGGKWALFGGYLDIYRGEGPLEAIYREIREESNGLIDLKALLPTPLVPFMDYKDKYSAACFCMGYLFIVHKERAEPLRAKLKEAIAAKNFDTEVVNIDLVAVNEHLAATVFSMGGMGYAHEMRLVEQAIAALPKKIVEVKEPYTGPDRRSGWVHVRD